MKIIKSIHFLSLIAATFLLANCASSDSIEEAETINDTQAPKWFLEMPDQDEDWVYAWAEASSRQMQLAHDKARARAKAKLSQRIAETVRSRVTQSLGSLGDFSEGNEENLNKFAEEATLESQNTIQGSILHKNNIYPYKEGYRCFVCLKVPKNSIVKNVKNSLGTQSNALPSGDSRQKLEKLIEDLNEDNFFE